MHPRFNSRGLWFVVFLNFLFLLLFFAFFEYQIIQIRNSQKLIVTPKTVIMPTGTPVVVPMPSSQPVSTSSPASSPKPTPTTQTSKSTKITYIPLTGGNTQNTDWTDVEGSSFLLNIGDYGTGSYIVWDANLRVGNSNGTTFARLFDKTHGIAVNGSEISLSDTSVSTDVVSASMSFWSGNNSYIIQIKSLNSSVGFIDSGRIKISY